MRQLSKKAIVGICISLAALTIVFQQTWASPGQLKNKLVTLINTSNVQKISIYIYNFSNQRETIINEGTEYVPASLMKISALFTYYKLAETDPSILGKTFIFTGSKNKKITQTIPPRIKLISGKAYTVEELIKRMIVYSDNDAGDVLFSNIDRVALTNVFLQLHIDVPNYFSPKYETTVKEYAKFFLALYKHSYLNNTMSEKALMLLSQTDYKKGLAAGIPTTIRVAHKFGERAYQGKDVKQFHECGIVYTHDPYLLCVMTEGDDIKQQSDLVKSISNTVYQSYYQ